MPSLRFGAHCIKGTVGARLVLEMDDCAEAAPNECIVDSITLNDFEGTDLEAQLDRIRRERGLACLFISHNLAVVTRLAERVLVMYRGRIVRAISRP